MTNHVLPEGHETKVFEIPEGAQPVLLQAGATPVRCIGWFMENEDLPGLLRAVADELDEIMKERDAGD